MLGWSTGEAVTSAALNNPSDELLQFRDDLKEFLNHNAQYWSVPTLSKFLGVGPEVIQKFIPVSRPYNTKRAPTILILRARDEASKHGLNLQLELSNRAT